MFKQAILLALVGAASATGSPMVRDSEDCLVLSEGQLEFGSCKDAAVVNFSFDDAENYLYTTVGSKKVCLGAQKGKKNAIKLGACKDDPRYKWYATEDNFANGKNCKQCITAKKDGTAILAKCKTSFPSVTIENIDAALTGKCPGSAPPTPPAPPKKPTYRWNPVVTCPKDNCKPVIVTATFQCVQNDINTVVDKSYCKNIPYPNSQYTCPAVTPCPGSDCKSVAPCDNECFVPNPQDNCKCNLWAYREKQCTTAAGNPGKCYRGQCTVKCTNECPACTFNVRGDETCSCKGTHDDGDRCSINYEKGTCKAGVCTPLLGADCASRSCENQCQIQDTTLTPPNCKCGGDVSKNATVCTFSKTDYPATVQLGKCDDQGKCCSDATGECKVVPKFD